MRSDMTDAERKLWRAVRAGRLLGIKFRRQIAIGRYIVDFVAPSKRLIVELDGSQHADNQDYDAARTAFLGQEGYVVLRFWNHEVLTNMDGVLRTILAAAEAFRPAQDSPLPARAKARESTLSPEGRGN